MKRSIQLLTVLAVVASLIVGASAFTTGSVDRASSMNVTADDAGLIGLEDGTSGNLVYQNDAGQLEIDFTNGSADGVNDEAHYELGNPGNATNQNAFSITNNDDEQHTMSVEYTGASQSESPDENMQFQVYNNTGDLVTTVSEENTVQTFDATSGETHYVVLVIDTYGADTSDDFSGTLNVSV